MKKVLIWTVSVVVVLFLVAGFGFSAYVMHEMLDERVHYARTWQAESFGLPTPDTLRLTACDGMKTVALQVSPEAPKAVVICLTGIQNPSVTCFWGHVRLFYDAGYASVLLEVRGHEPSDGDRICCGYQEPRDVAAAVEYLKSQPRFAEIPIVVMGISMGAGVAINSIGTNDDIDALVSISAFSSLEDFFVEFVDEQLPWIPAWCIRPFVLGTTWVKYGVNPWTMRPKTNIAKLHDRPALLFHTQGDTQVKFANFTRIMENAPDNVQTFVRKEEEHFFISDFTAPQADSTYCQRLMSFLDAAVAR